MNFCIICGVPVTHHHKYCDKHYPQKTATILQLKKLLTAEVKKTRKLENKLFHLNILKNQYKREVKQLKEV